MNEIIFENVHFAYGNNKIYKGLNFSIPTGKITCILGPSGTGKTTLLKLIGGLIKADNGKVIVRNENMSSISNKQLMFKRKEMGVLFQSGALFTHLSVSDNIAFPLLENSNLPENIIKNIIKIKLEAVSLRDSYNQFPSELSGGMSRRVALARAIALDPKIMMYDEPFTGQDPISFATILRLIKTLNDSLGMTSILVSHDIQESLTISDYVVVLSDGIVLAEGTPFDIQNNKSKKIKQFLNGDIKGPLTFDHQKNNFFDREL